mgnify:CR=1 FL=1
MEKLVTTVEKKNILPKNVEVKQNHSDWVIEAEINNRKLKILAITIAQCNVMSSKTLDIQSSQWELQNWN